MCKLIAAMMAAVIGLWNIGIISCEISKRQEWYDTHTSKYTLTRTLTHKCTLTYMQVHAHACKNRYIHMDTHTYNHSYMHAHTFTCTFIYSNTHIHAGTRNISVSTCTHTYSTYAYIHACKHTHTCKQSHTYV